MIIVNSKYINKLKLQIATVCLPQMVSKTLLSPNTSFAVKTKRIYDNLISSFIVHTFWVKLQLQQINPS